MQGLPSFWGELTPIGSWLRPISLLRVEPRSHRGPTPSAAAATASAWPRMGAPNVKHNKHMYIYIYIYMCICSSLSLYIYMYIYICMSRDFAHAWPRTGAPTPLLSGSIRSSSADHIRLLLANSFNLWTTLELICASMMSAILVAASVSSETTPDHIYKLAIKCK